VLGERGSGTRRQRLRAALPVLPGKAQPVGQCVDVDVTHDRQRHMRVRRITDEMRACDQRSALAEPALQQFVEDVLGVADGGRARVETDRGHQVVSPK
jgi:hypothetical protein